MKEQLISFLEQHERLCRFLAERMEHTDFNSTKCDHCRLLRSADQAADLRVAVSDFKLSLEGIGDIL
jgi:hypothetical protein